MTFPFILGILATAQTDTNGEHEAFRLLEGTLNTSQRCLSYSDLASTFSFVDSEGITTGRLFLSHDRGSHCFKGAVIELELSDQLRKQGPVNWTSAWKETRYLPHGVAKRFEGPAWAVRTFLGFEGHNVAAFAVEIENSTAFEQIVHPLVRINLGQPMHDLSLKFEGAKGLLHARWRSPETDGRDPRPDFPMEMIIQTTLEPELVTVNNAEPPVDLLETGAFSPPTIDVLFDAQPVKLRPKETTSLCFRLGLAAEHDIGRFGEWIDRPLPKLEALETECRTRWRKLFESAPKALADRPEFERKIYYHGQYVLTRNMYTTTGPNFKSKMGGFPSKDHYCAHYNWDSVYHAVALARFNPATAKDAITILAENRTDEGKWHQFVCSDWGRPGPASQPPVAFWGCREIYRATADKVWLAQMYPALVDWERWWRTERDSDQNGLSEYVEPLDSGWDNSPRWDGNVWPIEPVDLNSLLLIGRGVLAWMARELGHPEEETEKWKELANKTAGAILEHHYDPDDNRFYDRYPSANRLNRLLTPASFYPLWASVPLDEKTAKTMIEETLLDPDVLGGRVPFPTVARNEKTFTPDGYWRGPVWINQAYVLLGVLERYGYEQEAQKAREALLALNDKNDWIWEYYDAETGRGLGVPEYGWSAALFMEMVLNDTHLP